MKAKKRSSIQYLDQLERYAIPGTKTCMKMALNLKNVKGRDLVVDMKIRALMHPNEFDTNDEEVVNMVMLI